MSERQGPVGIAVVGTGNISPEYLRNLTTFPDIEVRWITGRNQERAAARADEFGIPHHGRLADALGDDSVEIVVDLTVPSAHLEVGLAALAAGKHLWSEKPLGGDLAGARLLMQAAQERGLRVAVAPDTILGPALQSAQSAIVRGHIGRPVFATISFESSGPELWHPDPGFLYAEGAGPLFDVGPYFVTGLVHLLGSVSRVSATATRSSDARVTATGPNAGTQFPVIAPTTVVAVLEFVNGVIARGLFSYDSMGAGAACLDVMGTEGLLSAVSGEEYFARPATVHRGDGEQLVVPCETTAYRRGIGVLDLARSIREGVPERTPGELGVHVMEVLAGIEAASRDKTWVSIRSTAPVVTALGHEWDPITGTLDAKGQTRGSA